MSAKLASCSGIWVAKRSSSLCGTKYVHRLFHRSLFRFIVTGFFHVNVPIFFFFLSITLSLMGWSMWLIPLMKSVCRSQRRLLVRKSHLDLCFLTQHPLTKLPSPLAEKMISSEALEGVPLLVLANKQDVPVKCDHYCHRTLCNIHEAVHDCSCSPFQSRDLSNKLFHQLNSKTKVIRNPDSYRFILTLSFQSCLSVPDIKTAFSDSAPKIGRRDCLVQPCTALTG